MELTFDAKDGVQILLRLDVLAQVIGQNPPCSEVGIGNRMKSRLSGVDMILHFLFIVRGLIYDEVGKT